MITPNFRTDTKIVGVNQLNDGGNPIQDIIPSLAPGDRLIFIRDYSNKYDSNAIKVFNKDSAHCGYISKELAANVSPFLDKYSNYSLEGIVKTTTWDKESDAFGCNIRIWVQDASEPNYDDVKAHQSYLNRQSTQHNIYSTHQPSAPSNTNKSRFWRTFTIVSILCTVILLIIYLGLKGAEKRMLGNVSDYSSSNSVDSRLITLNEFNQLRSGMTRSEVYNIVGSFGELVTESSTDGYRVTIYSYEGYGEIGANAQIMFVNGELDTKSQAGLDYYFDN